MEGITSKKTKWQKTRPFWISIWLIFNPITALILSMAFFLRVYLIITPVWKNNSNLMKTQLLPLCNGDHYIYNDYDHNEIRFSYNSSLSCYSRYGKLESCFFDYSDLDLLAFTSDHYYFLVRESKNNKKYVCRTTHDLENFETLCYLGDFEIKKQICGYDSKLYYESEEQYYVFDLYTLELQTVDSDSEEAMVVKSTKIINHYKSHGYYESISGTYFGDCTREKDMCCFAIDGTNYTFDEKSIKPEVFELMNAFSFKPKYHLSSLNTGISAIIYYANEGFGGESECLIVEYSRLQDNAAQTYQLFTYVNQYLFSLFPMISFQ